MAQIFPEGAGMDKAEDPVQLPDGTLRCLTHHLESCETCGVDYTFMREVLAEDAYEEEQRQIKRAKRNATVSSRLSNAKKCIDGCAALEGTTKRCSACKVSFEGCFALLVLNASHRSNSTAPKHINDKISLRTKRLANNLHYKCISLRNFEPSLRELSSYKTAIQRLPFKTWKTFNLVNDTTSHGKRMAKAEKKKLSNGEDQSLYYIYFILRLQVYWTLRLIRILELLVV